MDDGVWAPMTPVPGDAVNVRARDARGREDEDAVKPARPGWRPSKRAADGSDKDCVDAWPEKGIFGTQLGPNRNGTKSW